MIGFQVSVVLYCNTKDSKGVYIFFFRTEISVPKVAAKTKDQFMAVFVVSFFEVVLLLYKIEHISLGSRVCSQLRAAGDHGASV